MPQLIYKEPDFFNSLSKRVHSEENHKWWYKADGSPIDNPDHRLKLLIISEIIEAMEGDRKGLMDDHLPNRPMVEVELADAVIRLLDRMAGKGLPKFRHVYRFREIVEKGDITQQLYEIISLLTNGHAEVIGTEFIVYKILDTAISYGYDIFGAMEEKRIYNATRTDHTSEKREDLGGKRY